MKNFTTTFNKLNRTWNVSRPNRRNTLCALAVIAATLFLLLAIPSKAYASSTYTVKVDTGYLALRTAPSYDEANEIGELYTGDTVSVQDTSNGQYWWVYSPKLGKSGYVNKDYLR